MSRYIVVIDGSPGAYGIVVPDLPGCCSGGATTDEALRNAVEAIRLWVEDAIADGEAIPAARTAEELRRDPEVAEALAAGGVLASVPLLRDSGRPVRANVSMDAGILEAIDAAAAERGLTRSAFLASAATRQIYDDLGAAPAQPASRSRAAAEAKSAGRAKPSRGDRRRAGP